MPRYRTREDALSARQDWQSMTSMLHSTLKDDKRDGLSDAEYQRRFDEIPGLAKELVVVLRDADTAQQKKWAK